MKNEKMQNMKNERKENLATMARSGPAVIPINKQSSDIASGVNVSKDDLDAGVARQSDGYTRDCDELMLQAND